jgi:two-component system, NtrC family, response regulator AtoC
MLYSAGVARPRPPEETTLRATRTTTAVEAGAEAGELCLHVVLDKHVATHPLPREGQLVIGRGAEAEVRIADPSVSRRHAILHVGPPMLIEDLGSANGISLGGVKVPPGGSAAVEVGSVIGFGPGMIIVQRKAPPPRPRRVWSHGHFELRVEDECSRSERTASSFAILRVSTGDHPGATEAVSGALRPGDVLAQYGPGELEALLLDAPSEEASSVAVAVGSALAHAGIEARPSVVCFPRDAHTPEELLARASAAARPATSAAPPSAARARLLGQSLGEIEAVVARIARGTINVVLTGETGVGKELVAELVHDLSPRASHPLVKINCASLSEALLASELFGHEKGAFTGADRAKPGVLEIADGGTVFLDEVGELPVDLQPKLLRVIEDKVVTRVGALRGKAIDVRFVAATNRDLEAEVKAGRFRQDLYFRLSGFQLRVPSLRERPGDILEIADAFLQQGARAIGLPGAPKLSAAARDILLGYSWPGNVRELRNVVERAVLLCGEGEIRPEHLPTEKMQERVTLFRGDGANASGDALLDALAEREADAIRDALAQCGGNQTRAARLLGISRGTLLKRMSTHGLVRPRGPRDA